MQRCIKPSAKSGAILPKRKYLGHSVLPVRQLGTSDHEGRQIFWQKPGLQLTRTRTGVRSSYLNRHPRRLRPFSLSSIPVPILAPLVFTSLLLVLWTYKCLMLVIFQNKIIYMPNMPPFSRREKLEDYAKQCGRVEWREERMRSGDGTELALAVGELKPEHEAKGVSGRGEMEKVVILYFHGNGGSIPPRTPALSRILLGLNNATPPRSSLRHTILALSYRGYWTSRGRASAAGIRLDALAALKYVAEHYPDASIVLWGQSLGAGVACYAAAHEGEASLTDVPVALKIKYGGKIDNGSSEVAGSPRAGRIVGLILETPFTSIRDMLLALYPEKWLPYRYLGGLVWGEWDSRAAVARIVQRWHARDVVGQRKVLILEAERDELVPGGHAEVLAEAFKDGPVGLRKVIVKGALHNDVMEKSQARKEAIEFLREL